MKRVLRVAGIALGLCAGAIPVRGAQVVAGITSAFTTGTHQERQGRDTIPLLPLPLITLRVPLHRFEIDAEGMPPIGPVPYRSLYNNTSQSTKLSYAHASLRYALTPRLSVGIGETLYNQRTTYEQVEVIHGYIGGPGFNTTPMTFTQRRTETDSSRVPGLRFEARAEWPAGKRSWFAAEFAVTPSMHAIVLAEDRFEGSIATSIPITQPRPWSLHFALPETGSEVDASMTIGRPLGRYTLLYGVRYVNYIAHFDRSGALADRNSLVLPFIGFERTFGR